MGARRPPVLLAETEQHAGGRFRARFRRLDGSEHEGSGKYLEMEKARRLAMTWRRAGGEDPGESHLAFDLRAIPEGTELTLTHSRLK